MARMFGTDGVRGVAGSELTIELAMKLGQAGAYVLTKEKSHQPTIIVGCDTRISGGMLANEMCIRDSLISDRSIVPCTSLFEE